MLFVRFTEFYSVFNLYFFYNVCVCLCVYLCMLTFHMMKCSGFNFMYSIVFGTGVIHLYVSCHKILPDFN